MASGHNPALLLYLIAMFLRLLVSPSLSVILVFFLFISLVVSFPFFVLYASFRFFPVGDYNDQTESLIAVAFSCRMLHLILQAALEE